MSKKILIIDDDPDIAEVVKLVLEDEGYEVWLDETGHFFDHVQQLPDLVLLDLLIEGTSGELVAQKLNRQIQQP